MIAISTAVFIMMLIASGLGFAIAWAYKDREVLRFRKDSEYQKLQVDKFTEEQDSIIRYSNSLQSESLKLTQKNEKQAKRIQSLKEIVQQLENDKEFIFKEYEKFRREVKSQPNKSPQLHEEIEEIKDKNQKLKHKSDKWKVKFYNSQEQLKTIENEYLKIKKEKEQLTEKFSSSDINTSDMLELESNYKELKLQFLALTQEKKELEKVIHDENSQPEEYTNDTISKLEEEVVLLKQENRVLQEKKDKSSKSKNEKEELLNRIKNRSKQVDFSRIGKPDPRSNDDLKKLKGLGALIEQKFHAIGINTFYQLANFNEYDQKLFNFFLDLPQGKIESEKWVTQAKAMLGKSENEVPGAELMNRINSNIEKINFDRIGEASPAQKDNLQSITGIGPYIEQKLNAIGIFRLEQLARLSEEDIDEINGIMELAPGHIQSDDWVGQARRMK